MTDGKRRVPAKAAANTAVRPRTSSRPLPATDGLMARDLAVSAVFAVMVEHRAFDDAFARAAETRPLAARDRAFARAIASTVLRRHGELKAVLNRFLQKPLPEKQGRLEAVLLSAAAQLLVLQTPPHAAISLAVDQCHGDSAAERFAKLANAVLRRVSAEGPAILATLDATALNIPPWLLGRWRETYGEDLARRIASASLAEPALDLTVKGDGGQWAKTLSATQLPTGSLRLAEAGRIEELPGYDEGAWWVQDAAAALPAKLMGDINGRDVLDMCAAPGGKTAQLAMAGARVTALDKSPGRLKRLVSNLQRLGLAAETVTGDAADHVSDKLYDAVLVDAPCTSTGTIRRHPDVMHLKRDEDVAALTALQARILDHAAGLVKPGGRLIYCTCSLEADEGPRQIDAFLEQNAGFSRIPVIAGEGGIEAAWINAQGDLRTLPCHLDELPPGQRGMDGFFAARLQKAT